MSAPRGARKAASELAFHTFGRNPATTGVVFIAVIILLLIFIILFVVYMNKYKDCCAKSSGKSETFLGTSPLGNLNTGGNNPMWNKQMGDAGWGGSLHSTYQPGQARVWGASAEGGHTMAVAPIGVRNCGNGLGGGVSQAAIGEAQVLTAVQAVEPPPGATAKNMNDDTLVGVMNGRL